MPQGGKILLFTRYQKGEGIHYMSVVDFDLYAEEKLLAWAARIEVYFPNDGQGIYNPDTLQSMEELEDAGEVTVEANRGMFAARYTSMAKRVFLYYFPSEDTADDFCQHFATASPFPATTQVVLDAQVSIWRDEFMELPIDGLPGERQLLQRFEDDGDDADQTRRVDHYAYFGSEADAKRFAQSVPSEIRVDELRDDGDSWGVLMHSMSRLWPKEIMSLSGTLEALAEDNSGEYDGWEASVVKKKPGFFDRLRRKRGV